MQGAKEVRHAWQVSAAANMALLHAGHAARGRPGSMEWSMAVARAQSLIWACGTSVSCAAGACFIGTGSCDSSAVSLQCACWCAVWVQAALCCVSGDHAAACVQTIAEETRITVTDSMITAGRVCDSGHSDQLTSGHCVAIISGTLDSTNDYTDHLSILKSWPGTRQFPWDISQLKGLPSKPPA